MVYTAEYNSEKFKTVAHIKQYYIRFHIYILKEHMCIQGPVLQMSYSRVGAQGQG